MLPPVDVECMTEHDMMFSQVRYPLLLVTCIQYYLFMVGLSATKLAPPFVAASEEGIVDSQQD